MLNPRDASRPPARPTKQTYDEKPSKAATWVRPARAPLESGMLSNRKLDLHNVKRKASRRP